jgi:uncharacterized protein (TIGR02594 family)
VDVTAFSLAQRFVGLAEAKGPTSNAHVLAMLQLDSPWVEGDETAWCSAFVNYACWLLRLPRSKSLAARSWLSVGAPVALEDSRPGFDVVVLARGEGEQPGPEVLAAPGHVGFFAGLDGQRVWLLGGNQNDSVSVAPYNRGRVLGVRRLAA